MYDTWATNLFIIPAFRPRSVWSTRYIVWNTIYRIWSAWILEDHHECTNTRTRTAPDVDHHGHPDTTRHNIGVFNYCITTKIKCTTVVAVDHEINFVHITKQDIVQFSWFETTAYLAHMVHNRFSIWSCFESLTISFPVCVRWTMPCTSYSAKKFN